MRALVSWERVGNESVELKEREKESFAESWVVLNEISYVQFFLSYS